MAQFMFVFIHDFVEFVTIDATARLFVCLFLQLISLSSDGLDA